MLEGLIMNPTIGIVLATTERGEHCPLILYADSAGEIPTLAEQGSRGYEITNRRADGVVGISPEDEIEAEADDSPACTCCLTPVGRWQRSTYIATREEVHAS